MKIKKITIDIFDMDCSDCASKIEKKLESIDGIIRAEVSYANKKADIEYDVDKCSIRDIKEAVSDAGYEAFIESGEYAEKDIEKSKKIRLLKNKVVVGIILTVPIIIGSIFPVPVLQNNFILLILTTPIQFWVGGQYIRWMIEDIKNRSAGMYTLIAGGTLVAYLYSVFVTFFPSIFEQVGIPAYVYFDATATILTFVVIGQFLEMRAKGRASEAIRKLIGLQAKKAIKAIEKNGQREWIEIPVSEISVDDILLVKPGEKVPTDGEITKGESYLDESMVTGESEPILKSKDDKVIGATINTSSVFEMRATKVGRETMLAQIIKMVKQAQSTGTATQKLVDKVSAIFVPIVIISSLITFLIWYNFGPEPQLLYAIINMVAVLIIACPCALGLATPTSLTVAIGRGAQLGILIKNADSLENSNKVEIIVFDKTGTLTKEKREVSSYQIINNEYSKEYIFSLLYSVEQNSTHPVSVAVFNYLEKLNLKTYEVFKYEEILGLGVKAQVDNKDMVVGSQRLLEKENISISEDLLKSAIKLLNQAQTISFFAVDGKCLGYFAIADILREGTKEVIHKLKKMNIETAIISGDNKDAVNAIAAKLNIDKVFAEVLPEDKQKYILKLKEKDNYIVAMVGDGINDAPALVEANVGIAMGSGTDVAIESSDITLLRSDITLIPKIISLSKATMKNIKQNLVWAFGYNVLLVPVAMGLLYPVFGIMLSPIFAGAAMAFSSLSVVLNSLRLKKIKLD